jgi:colanic acid biosynthesis glycosyl transferase WcaI
MSEGSGRRVAQLQPYVAPHVIFLNRYFHPDHSATSQMLSGLAIALAARGLRISVISSQQFYDAPAVRLPPREMHEGVEVYRVPTSRFGRSHLWGRSVDYLTFYVSAGWRLWRLTRRGDIIVAQTDPPMLSLLAAPIARLRRARLINWLQDLFPEIAEALRLGGPARAAYRPLRWLRDRSLRSADMNVVLGDLMADKLVHLGVKPLRIRLIPNWADGDLIRPLDSSTNALRREWGLDDTIVVGYSGNLGRPHEIDTMLEAIATTQSDRHAREAAASPAPHRTIRWLFIGDGALSGPLKTALACRKLDDVTLKPYQPRERLAESLCAIDVHLVSLRPELEGLIVPSKFYGIAAAGRPTIFIGDLDGEIALLLKKHGCGLTVAQGDGTGLTRAVLELASNPTLVRDMGERARRAFDAEFNKTLAVARWEKLLHEVAHLSGRSQSA